MLPRGEILRGGDLVTASDGRVIEIVAEPEKVLHIETKELAKIAYHLGNRHVPVQVGEDFLRIAEDHVLEEMVKKLGAKVSHVEAPFEPEAGAYAGGATSTTRWGTAARSMTTTTITTMVMTTTTIMSTTSTAGTTTTTRTNEPGETPAAGEPGPSGRRLQLFRRAGSRRWRRASSRMPRVRSDGSATCWSFRWRAWKRRYVFCLSFLRRRSFAVKQTNETSSPAARPRSCAPRRCRWAIRSTGC